MNDAYPAKYRKAVEAALIAKHISFVPQEYIDDLEITDGQVKTRSGKIIKADLVVGVPVSSVLFMIHTF